MESISIYLSFNLSIYYLSTKMFYPFLCIESHHVFVSFISIHTTHCQTCFFMSLLFFQLLKFHSHAILVHQVLPNNPTCLITIVSLQASIMLLFAQGGTKHCLCPTLAAKLSRHSHTVEVQHSLVSHTVVLQYRGLDRHEDTPHYQARISPYSSPEHTHSPYLGPCRTYPSPLAVESNPFHLSTHSTHPNSGHHKTALVG